MCHKSKHSYVFFQIFPLKTLSLEILAVRTRFFPGPLAFYKKAVERVSSEKNILNSSVECVEWSGVLFFKKMSYVCTTLGPPQ